MKKFKLNHLFKAILLFSLLNGCKSAGTYDHPQSLTEAPYHEEVRFNDFTNHPKQIALLLPLSGRYADSAKAIREGFLASYYQHNGAKPIIKMYDTAKEKDIQHLYEVALDEGADFVVGPLSKEEVHRLGQRSSLKAPVLALNHHPDVHPTKDFVQYTLAPEAEAE